MTFKQVWLLIFIHFSNSNYSTKGQLILKANCQAVNSPKKQMKEFFWREGLLRSKVKCCSFLGRIYGVLFCLRFFLTFKYSIHFFTCLTWKSNTTWNLLHMPANINAPLLRYKMCASAQCRRKRGPEGSSPPPTQF